MSKLPTQLKEKLASGLVFPNDLGAVKALNVQSLNANTTLLPIINEFTNGKLYGTFLYQKISELKNYNFQLWDYSGYEKLDGFSIEVLEGLLFLWGKACISKIGSKYFISNFSVSKNDRYGNPTVVQPQSNLNETKLGKKKVGTECVLIYGDTNFFLPNVKNWFGPLWRVWSFLNELNKVWELINMNAVISRSVVFTDVGTSQENIQNMKRALLSTSPVIPLSSMKRGVSSAGTSMIESVDFKDRTKELWINYNCIWAEIKKSLGIDTNDGAGLENKERQLQGELSMGNQLAEGQRECWLYKRKEGLEEVNKVFGTALNVDLRVKEEQTMEKENDNEE